MLAPAVLKQLTRELQELATSEDIASLGIRVKINEVDITDISAELDGPPGTPYAGGVFAMRLSLPPDFPVSPPRGYFLTKIYHPNVSKAGEICVNVLKRDWKPDLGARPAVAHHMCMHSTHGVLCGVACVHFFTLLCQYVQGAAHSATPAQASNTCLPSFGACSLSPIPSRR
jgi:ubiquitin-protein ligase